MMTFRTRPLPSTPNPFRTQKITTGRRVLLRKRRPFARTRSDLRAQIVKFLGWGAVAAASLVLIFLVVILADLPSLDKLREGGWDESTKVFDRNGGLLYEIHGPNTGRRTVLGLAQVSPRFIDALLAAEDDEFYEHNGFDWKGLIQGAILNPLTGKRIRGGSTITQQLIKNSLLSPERTISRKVRELALALLTEKEFTKDEILEMHINQITFGSNAYGVAAAAKTFFNKKASELSLAEAATLAVLPRAPTYYSPYGSNTEALLWRRNWVLSRMESLGKISQTEMQEAKQTPLEVVPYREDIRAPHFVMFIKEKLVELYGEEMVEKGGLTVYTTLDPKLQEAAEEALAWRQKYNTDYYDATNAALVAVRPETGEIVALAGSYDYFNKEIDGAVNVATRLRQPGSSIKPFAYAAAFEKGYSPATVVYDVKTNFAEGGEKYEPWNYDNKFRGPVSLRAALQQSLNVPAVKTLFLAGVPETIALLAQAGVTSLTDPERYGLALILGGGETRLLEMTAAYATLAAAGRQHALQSLLLVQDKNGRMLYEMPKNAGEQVLDENVAYLVTNVLSDNVARAPAFGAQSWLQLGARPAAVKTGTTNEYRDAWTIGYTPSLVAGVWAGNNDNHPMKNRGGGAGVAAPIWNRFMKNALQNVPIAKFSVPGGVRFVEVSKLSGKLPSRFTPQDKIVKEVFLENRVPTEEDDFYATVATNALDGLRANEHCPAGAIEHLIYENFHSILPDKQSWESAVQNWATHFRAKRQERIFAGEEVDLPDFAQGSKMRFVASLGDIPDELSPLCTPEVAAMPPPHLRILEPADFAQQAPGKLVVKAAVTPSERPVTKVEFYLENELQDTVKYAHHADGAAQIFWGELTLPPAVEKVYKIKVLAYDDLYHAAQQTLSVEARIDKTPPRVEVLSPRPSAEIFWNTRLQIKMSIRDEDGAVERAEIYLDRLDETSRLVTLEKAPFTWDWFLHPQIGVGAHQLIVRAFDNQGNFVKEIVPINIQNPASETAVVPGAKIGAIIAPSGSVKLNERTSLLAKFRSLRFVRSLSFYAAQQAGGEPQLLQQFSPQNNERYLQTTWAPATAGQWKLWFVATFTNGQEVESERIQVEVK